MTCLLSCGKRAELKDKQNNNIQPSRSELFTRALRLIEQSIQEQDYKKFKRAIDETPGFDLNYEFVNGETILTMTMKEGLDDFSIYLIEKGANIERKNFWGRKPLLVAVAEGRKRTIEVLLDFKVDIETQGPNGNTALHLALKSNHDDIALLLIKYGAQVNAKDNEGNDAFSLARKYRTPETLSFLNQLKKIESGAPDIPTFRALLEKADFDNIARVLRRYPELVETGNYEELNPLAILVDSPNEKNALRSAELLLSHKTSVNGPQDAEYTPLIRATVKKKKIFADLFLVSKADPSAMDKQGKSALIHAIEANNPDLVELLLSYSALEKYTFRINGRRITIKACDYARDVNKRLTDPEERQINENIRQMLECGFLGWIF